MKLTLALVFAVLLAGCKPKKENTITIEYGDPTNGYYRIRWILPEPGIYEGTITFRGRIVQSP